MGILDKILGKSNTDTETPKTVEAQSPDDKKLCDYVKKKIEEIRSQANRIAHEGIWMTNIAYVLGFDSVYYDPQMRQYRPVASGNKFLKRNRIHSNIILPALQNRLARLCKSPPKYDTRPNSMDQEDKDAAQLGLEAIGMVMDRQHANKKRLDLMMWVQECGHAYLKVCWDVALGDPMLDPDGTELAGYMGDIRLDVCSPFEIFTDPLAKTLEEASYLIQAKVRPLEYFRIHYPDRGTLVKEEGAWLLSAQYEMRINTLSTVGPNSSGTSEQMKNAAIELNYYEKPSTKHKHGRHIVVGNGVLLQNKELAIGKIPFSKFDDVVIGGKYYSESLVTHARPLQDQYNRTLSKRAEWVNKCLAGKYIAARGHGLQQGAINDTTEVVEYDPVVNAQEPRAMIIPMLPEYAYKDTDALKKEINELFGLSEVSRGNLPSSSIPAIGMQILLEQDETRIGIEVEQHEYAWAQVGQYILDYMDEYYIEPRTLKSKGSGMDMQVRKFTGQDLRKNKDVTVIRGSTVPNSKVINRQEIMNLFQSGLLGNPQDPAVKQKVLGMLQYGDTAEAWKERALDMAQIQRTIKQIEQEIPPEIHEFDNHMLHIAEKNDYRKSEKFSKLSKTSQDLMNRDIYAHGEAGAKLANPQLFMPPDQGPPPEQALAQLQQQGQEMGIAPGAPMAQNG